MNIQRSLLLIAGTITLVTVGAVAYTSRHRSPAARSAPSPGAQVVRLVKNPKAAPPFKLQDLSGKVVSSADWSGKVVLLDFWATWCAPCRKEIPELIALQEQYPDRLRIIGVSEDDDPPEKVRQFAQKQGINYPVVMATPELIAAYGGVPALPTVFVLDTQGRVVQKHAGLYPADSFDHEIEVLAGLDKDSRVETFDDTGQVFLTNAANATELPDVDFAGLTPAQKKIALHRLNAEGCTCGCGLTLAECRMNDTSCPVSKTMAAKVVSDVAHGITSEPTPVSQKAPPS